MNREEAIRRLKDHFRVHDDGRPTPYLDEAVRMVFEDLRKLTQYEDLSFTPEEIAVLAKFYKEHTSVASITADMKMVANSIELQRYKDLEKQGRLIELPCAVGDVLYDSNKEFVVREISFWEDDCDLCALNIKIEDWKENFEIIAPEDIGETVFFTKEEAEAKLKELRGKQE